MSAALAPTIKLPEVQWLELFTDENGTVLSPEVDTTDAKGADRVLVLGDIDANPMMLLKFLIVKGVVVLNNEVYQELAKIYVDSNTTPVSPDTAKHFLTLLNQATIDRTNLQMLLLIGDTLSDRGSNDLLTLLMYLWLSEKKLPFKVLSSNHDTNFCSSFRATEQQFATEEKKGVCYIQNLPNFDGQVNSLVKFIDTLKAEHPPLTIKQVRELINQHYLPHLQALTYTRSKDKMRIYSHAAIDLKLIHDMALTLGLSDCKVDSPNALAATIDRINTEFSLWAMQPGGLEALVILGEKYRLEGRAYNYTAYNPLNPSDVEKLRQEYWKTRRNPPYKDRINYSDAGPFTKLIWSRDYTNIHPDQDCASFAKQGCELCFIHGHDDTDLIEEVEEDADEAADEKKPALTFVLNVNNSGIITIENQASPPLPTKEDLLKKMTETAEKFKKLEAEAKKSIAAVKQEDSDSSEEEEAAEEEEGAEEEEKNQQIEEGIKMINSGEIKAIEAAVSIFTNILINYKNELTEDEPRIKACFERGIKLIAMRATPPNNHRLTADYNLLIGDLEAFTNNTSASRRYYYLAKTELKKCELNPEYTKKLRYIEKKLTAETKTHERKDAALKKRKHTDNEDVKNTEDVMPQTKRLNLIKAKIANKDNKGKNPVPLPT